MRWSRTLAVVAAAGVLVGGANLAVYAANGRPLLLGRSNKETRPAVLENTGAGPAFKFRTKGSAAPFTVSSGTKVVRLNADLVDGVDASALQTRVYRYQLPPQTQIAEFTAAFPGLPAGRYLASFNLTFIGSGDAQCKFQGPEGYSVTAAGSHFSSATTVQGTGIVENTAQGHELYCDGLGTFDMNDSYGREVTFLPLDAMTTVQGEVTPLIP